MDEFGELTREGLLRLEFKFLKHLRDGRKRVCDSYKPHYMYDLCLNCGHSKLSHYELYGIKDRKDTNG